MQGRAANLVGVVHDEGRQSMEPPRRVLVFDTPLYVVAGGCGVTLRNVCSAFDRDSRFVLTRSRMPVSQPRLCVRDVPLESGSPSKIIASSQRTFGNVFWTSVMPVSKPRTSTRERYGTHVWDVHLRNRRGTPHALQIDLNE